MQHQVIVSFGKDQEFDFKLGSIESGGLAAEQARMWFGREFEALEILAVDRILSVAKYAGEARFREQPEWAQQFVRHTVAILGRDLIRVDVVNYSIGY